jgi:hypothetical protein
MANIKGSVISSNIEMEDFKFLDPIMTVASEFGFVTNPKVDNLFRNIEVFIENGRGGAKKNSFKKIIISRQRIYKESKAISLLCKAKIIDYKRSGHEFGFSTLKKGLIGEVFLIDELLTEYQTRNNNIIDGMVICTPDRKLKFVKEDIEIIYPNYKGYSVKKDRTLEVGSIVNLKKPKLGFQKELIVSSVIRSKKTARPEYVSVTSTKNPAKKFIVHFDNIKGKWR